MSRTCSQCGNNGHNSRTCTDGENVIMLFGVRLTEAGNNSSFRKSVSMNNLSQYVQHPPQDSNVADTGYVSDDVVHASGRTRERKRGVPWTEDEHKMFLLGLQQVGKGDWRGISRNFVKTRTPTQVASRGGARIFILGVPTIKCDGVLYNNGRRGIPTRNNSVTTTKPNSISIVTLWRHSMHEFSDGFRSIAGGEW